MGTPLGLFTGAWFSLFGGAVLWWCAAEVRARRTLRRVGVNGMARVVVDPDEAGDHADTAPLLSFQVEGHGEVVTRPRGWTSIRRVPTLAVDALVPVSYDPAQPTLVVLDGTPQGRSDLFWLCLGLAFAACGVMLLAAAL
ncbi:hypothetical protein ABIA32_005634 [Streptacidiphilus sp. MAP12-20]|uniref:DUF3592 domain-containing protein n=1 Tax=Streptacidiphilus sp. MAP12-20 TaxID=3156299 RepID=UPI003516CC57